MWLRENTRVRRTTLRARAVWQPLLLIDNCRLAPCVPVLKTVRAMANTVSSMVLFGATLTATALLTCMPAASQPSQKQGERCRIATAPSGWPTYVDRLHGFCFRYPPTYAPVAQPWLKKYTNAPNKSALNRLRTAAQEGRMLRLQHKQDTAVSITAFLTEQPFNLESFVAGAPTGIEDPPEPKQFGAQTFYYYGPGGGGVAYPDQS